MSGALKVIGVIAGVVAIIASAGAAIPAVASALGVSAGTLSTIAAIAGVVAGVAGMAAQLLTKPPPARGSVSQMMIATDAPQPYVMGEGLFAGVLRYQRSYGAALNKIPNPYRFMAVVYSGGGPVESLTPYVDQAPVSGWYAGFLYATTSLGSCPAAALVPNWPGAPGWDASSKLSGKAAAGWSLLFDKDGKRFASGMPQTAAYGRWVKVYDPRRDSTFPGGSGLHRLGAESTYEWSENPALHAGTYAYGRYQNGKRVLGMGLPADAIDWVDVASWANVCTANNWTLFGPVYEGGTSDVAAQRWANLRDICIAGGGEPVLDANFLGFDYSRPRVTLDTISAADLVEDAEHSVVAQASWRDRLNTVLPKYRSPAHNWELVQAGAVIAAPYVADDGEVKQAEWPFNLVKQAGQAAALARYRLEDSRELGPIELVCGQRLMAYRPGDCLALNLESELGLTGPAIILKRHFDPQSLTVTLTLRTETAAKHPYALGQAGAAPISPYLGQTSAQRDAASAAALFSNTAIVAELTNPAAVVSADAAGNVASFAGVGGYFGLTRGGTAISAGITYAVVSSTGVTISIDASGNYAISGMSSDTGQAVLRATFEGDSYVRAYSIAKARIGATGSAGIPGTPGTNGQTFYTWYAYADSADGVINFTTGAPGTRIYQGAAAGRTAATESTNAADYVWSIYTGPPGFGLAAANGAEVSGNKLVGRSPVAWNQQVYSTESFVGGAYVSFKIEKLSGGDSGSVMVGLNTDPTATDWTTLDYAFYVEGGITSGNLFAAESGAQVALGTWVPTDSFAVHYDGARIRYYKNGTVIRTVTGLAAGIRFFLDSALANTGVHASITAWAAAGAAGDPGAPGVSPWALNLSPPSVTIRTSSTGVVNTGQLPRPVAVSLLQGTVDQLAGAVITLVPSSAAIAGTYSAGSISLTQADASGYIDVTATVAGTAVATKRVEIVRQADPAPPISATSLSGSALNAISAASFAPPDLALTMAANAAGQIVLQSGARYLVQDTSPTVIKTITLAGCAAWRAEASGIWSYGTEVIGSQAKDDKQISATEGTISISQTITGLTPGARYVMGLSLRKSAGTASIADASIDLTVHQ